MQDNNLTLKKSNFLETSPDSWLSLIPSEREWQILNGLIRMSCELNKIEIDEPNK